MRDDTGTRSIAGGVHEGRRHDSAHKHVAGEAVYIDDMVAPEDQLHVYPGLSERAHARIAAIDSSRTNAGVPRNITLVVWRFPINPIW